MQHGVRNGREPQMVWPRQAGLRYSSPAPTATRFVRTAREMIGLTNVVFASIATTARKRVPGQPLASSA
jgi:hypothetical protein